jgi:hypothetical protein
MSENSEAEASPRSIGVLEKVATGVSALLVFAILFVLIRDAVHPNVEATFVTSARLLTTDATAYHVPVDVMNTGDEVRKGGGRPPRAGGGRQRAGGERPYRGLAARQLAPASQRDFPAVTIGASRHRCAERSARVRHAVTRVAFGSCPVTESRPRQ